MFSKTVTRPPFLELTKGLFGYDGSIVLPPAGRVEVMISGRSTAGVDLAITELTRLRDTLAHHMVAATPDAYGAFEVARELKATGEYDPAVDGGYLPQIDRPEAVWSHMRLDTIAIAPKDRYPVRLSFRCAWDVEHDFGILLRDGRLQYAGVSV